MNRGTRRRLLGSGIAALLGLAGPVMITSSAEAAYVGNAYLVVTNGNCVGGGTVTGIFGAVGNVWSGGDSGDNIIYPRVRVGESNQFNGRAFCSRPSYRGGSYWINVVGKDFTPSRNAQTFYF